MGGAFTIPRAATRAPQNRSTRPVPQGPVGVGVPDDPFLRPPPALPRSSDPLVGAGFHPRPGVGFGWAELAVLLLVVFTLCCCFHPISLVLPKETGWSPKEKRLGWWRPREVSGPARLSHSRGSCHSAAEVSAPRTIAIWALRAAGMVKTPRRGVFLFQYGVRGKPT